LGTHVKNGNGGNVGISMIGDYNRDPLTDAQKESLKRLVTFLALKYRIDPRQKGFLEPHRHFRQGEDNDTDCPGKNVIAYLPLLRDQIKERTFSDMAALGSVMPVGAGGPAADFQPLVVTEPGG
jgi:hypothetical protein